MSLRSGSLAKARKIAGSLVVAFPEASPPLVWKFDLEKNHSFTLTLQGEEGDWELGITSPRGEFYPIARFLAREDAEEAFLRAQKSLFRREYDLWRFWGPIFAGLFFISVVIFMIGHSEYRSLEKRLQPNVASTQSMPQIPSYGQATHPPLPVRPGVPVPADQILTPPE